MNILFWNVRGLGNPGRRRQLIEVVKENKIDVICLQETIRVSFKMRELNSFCSNKDFEWLTKPAVGHSGGLLLGINSDLFKILDRDVGEFCLGMVLESKLDNKRWVIYNIYGPVQSEKKDQFLQESSSSAISLSETSVS